jgi:hypothetical protein
VSDETAHRLERLEASVAHLEHQVEQLNEVVIEQGPDRGPFEENSDAPSRRDGDVRVGPDQDQQSPAAASLTTTAVG